MGEVCALLNALLVLRCERYVRNFDGITTTVKLRFRLVEKSPAETTYRRKFVSIRDGRPCPRRCAGGGIRGAINNSIGSRNLMITVTVQLTSTRLIVRKSVDDTHGITCDR